MDHQVFMRELSAARRRGYIVQQRARADVLPGDVLPEVLEELRAELEELRVTEEHIRAQTAQLASLRQEMEAERERWRDLFHRAPAAYLITDTTGIIRAASLRAAELLGIGVDAVAGKPLAVFVSIGDRWRLRDLLGKLGYLDAGKLEILLRPRGGVQAPAAAVVEAICDDAGRIVELRWLLHALPASRTAPSAEQEPPATASQGAVAPALTALGSPASWEELSEILHEVVDAILPLLRADRAGVMLVGADGSLRWATTTDEAGRAFEQAQQHLGEGPCIDAFGLGRVAWTPDLRKDPRWGRLNPAAAANRIRGVLAVPIVFDGRRLGTCSALTAQPRGWTDADVGAISTFASVAGRLLATALDAHRTQVLSMQLQQALDSRVVIEQAKGVVMERRGVSARDAFLVLRRMARSQERKLADVAREVIGERST